MINKYNKWQQAGPLNTEHKEMILYWKVLAYKWIITEVFQSNEEFDNPPPCIYRPFVWHRFDQINGFTLNLYMKQCLYKWSLM